MKDREIIDLIHPEKDQYTLALALRDIAKEKYLSSGNQEDGLTLRAAESSLLECSCSYSPVIEKLVQAQRNDWIRLKRQVLKQWGFVPEVYYLVKDLGIWPVRALGSKYLFVKFDTGELVGMKDGKETLVSQDEILTFHNHLEQLDTLYLKMHLKGDLWKNSCRKALQKQPPRKRQPGTRILTDIFLLGEIAKHGPLDPSQITEDISDMVDNVTGVGNKGPLYATHIYQTTQETMWKLLYTGVLMQTTEGKIEIRP